MGGNEEKAKKRKKERKKKGRDRGDGEKCAEGEKDAQRCS